MNELNELRLIQKNKYLNFKKEEEKNNNISLLRIHNLNNNKINFILENKLIEKIQKFFRKYTLHDKICNNNINDINKNDIIKIRVNDKIYGYHYLQLEKQFSNIGYCDIISDTIIRYPVINKIINNIKKKNKFLSITKTNYFNFEGFYNYEIYEIGYNEILELLNSRGINKISMPYNLFELMLTYEPGVYAIEVITDDINNINKSYCIFEDFPNYQEIIKLPLGVYQQLNVNIQEINFKYKIIKPYKGEKVVFKCLINPSNLFNDIKTQLTIELTKHKILSLNQIVCIQNDTNQLIVPFLVKELYPFNIIDITDIDLEIDFDECMEYNNSIESLISFIKL